jgi:poly(A) polymerase
LATEWVDFARSSIIEGDRLNGVTVAGFAFTPPHDGMPATSEDDRLLLDGDQALAEPPARRVPDGSNKDIQYTAILPAQRLALGTHSAATESMCDEFSNLLRRPDRPWHDIAEKIIHELHGKGHIVFLSGGAVRDIVAGHGTEGVNDLDMAGTAPAGQFMEIAHRQLTIAGKAHYRRRVWSSLVCSIEDGRPIIEYKALHQNGFRFPATGADLEVDAAGRDFTVNALFYDPAREQLLDPCSDGMADLKDQPRRLVPNRKDADPAQTGENVLRAIKFLHRWRSETIPVDDTAVCTWVAALPPNIWDLIDDSGWQCLRRTAEELAEKIAAAEAYSIAAELGSAAKALLDRLHWRTQ